MPSKTASDRARDLRAKHPDWSLAQLADRSGLSRSGVAKALRAKTPGKRGRRPDHAAKIKRLERELAAAKRSARKERA